MTEQAVATSEMSHRDHTIDEHLYAFLEHAFRSSEAAIKDRMSSFLNVIPENLSSPVLDTGWGRGEWLEVPRDAGVPGRGTDGNNVSVRECGRRVLMFSTVNFRLCSGNSETGAHLGSPCSKLPNTFPLAFSSPHSMSVDASSRMADSSSWRSPMLRISLSELRRSGSIQPTPAHFIPLSSISSSNTATSLQSRG